jgi:hypothetical protein
MQSERVRARRSAHQHECVDRGMSEGCEAVENDASDERGRPGRAPAKLARTASTPLRAPDPSDDPVEQFGSATPWSGSGIGASAPADITN